MEVLWVVMCLQEVQLRYDVRAVVRVQSLVPKLFEVLDFRLRLDKNAELGQILALDGTDELDRIHFALALE